MAPVDLSGLKSCLQAPGSCPPGAWVSSTRGYKGELVGLVMPQVTEGGYWAQQACLGGAGLSRPAWGGEPGSAGLLGGSRAQQAFWGGAGLSRPATTPPPGNTHCKHSFPGNNSLRGSFLHFVVLAPTFKISFVTSSDYKNKIRRHPDTWTVQEVTSTSGFPQRNKQ